MTDEAAYSQAKARWGSTAFATKGPLSPTLPDIIICRVGRILHAPSGDWAAIFGLGNTWEQAFQRATDYERHLKRSTN